MDQVVDIGSTDLVALIPSVPTAKTFTDEKEAEKLYAAVERIIRNHTPDTTTKAGRDAIKSLAHKVGKLNAAINKQRLALTKGWRDETKLVNAGGEKIEERLGELQDKARKPYDDWEAAEKARVDRHQDNLEGLIAIVETPLGKSSDELKEMLSAIEIMTIGDEWEEFKPKATVVRFDAIGALTRLIQVAEKSEADARELEALRADKERRDKEDAERQAKEDAERAEADRIENERIAEDQRQADIAKAAEEAATKAAQDAEQRVLDAERKAQDAIEQANRDVAAAQADADRLAELARQRIADEEEAQRQRDEDIEHRRTVNRAVVAKLVACSEISGYQARSIVAALIAGSVPHVTLKY